MGHANTARPVRDLAVDFYRVSGVVLIVLGHWLAGSVTYDNGRFGRQNPLVDQPWTQWLTWPFQAVPVFFLVAGYAGAVSWTHHRGTGEVSRQAWIRRRLARVLGPTAVYVALISLVVAVLLSRGVPGSVLDYAGWAVAMHLWFLAVYLVVVSLTPIAFAAHQSWGLMVPAVLAVAVVAVDATTLGGDIPYLGWLNYLLCWGMFYQLGIAWHGGLLTGRRAVLLAVTSAAALALLIWIGPYPASMIGVPGQEVQNTTPPSVAMLAFGSVQAGIAVTVGPALNRLLRSDLARRLLSAANNNVMALYLWHMVPVVIVAIVAYPAGWLPQPEQGTMAWWLARLEWEVVLSLVTAVEMVLLWWLRSIFAAPLPTFRIPLSGRWTEPVMLLGAAMSAYFLWFVATAGFAPSGSFPWRHLLIFAAGLLLVACRPATVSRPSIDATPRGRTN
ncbi:glucans biosynthesis protein [Mycobacterium basiliense]|uniref:Glucans biosynthesis protein n=1 Tax=Mycobacterium basiliense TaxID=2094119 RepID=A0A447GFH0_9MYCO|nr:acyltransferase [Mycobacterium basiliense]VDM89203.1 glucans biosynthesis protein [Mycobacterium basiliense]